MIDPCYETWTCSWTKKGNNFNKLPTVWFSWHVFRGVPSLKLTASFPLNNQWSRSRWSISFWDSVTCKKGIIFVSFRECFCCTPDTSKRSLRSIRPLKLANLCLTLSFSRCIPMDPESSGVWMPNGNKTTSSPWKSQRSNFCIPSGSS